jgi:hypothetical protein
MKPSPTIPDYAHFLTEVKGRVQTARLQAGRAVNRELVMLYWDIGRGIVERQKALAGVTRWWSVSPLISGRSFPTCRVFPRQMCGE